jgi:hypothetical protein
MGKIINLKDYKEKKDIGELAQRVANIIAMIELMQGKMPIYLIDEQGELVELGGERDPNDPKLIVPPHLGLVDDPDDSA